MSEDKTRDLSKKYDTKPTIETVLERIIAFEQGFNARLDAFEQGVNARLNAFEQGVNARIDNVGERMGAVEARLGGVENRIDVMDARIVVRFDRMESEIAVTRSGFFSLRADFTELKNALRDDLPAT